MKQAATAGIQPGRATLPALSENRTARFAAIIVLYFLQGVPLGLSLIALPAWLAEAGATPLEVGAFVGFALLPWSTKLFNGLVMDRYAFRPMGRRRGWILLSQALMVAALIVMAVIAPGAGDIALLSALCFALNLCATFNDVAVDGMAVDIVPEKERTAINSFMFASQSFGVAVCSILAGQTLVSYGIATTALLLTALVAFASLFVSVFRERPGERLLPWSMGQASRECEERQHDAWWPILSGVLRSVFVPRTLLFLFATGCGCAYLAFADAVNPTLAVQQLGWSSERYANFGALLNITAAGFGLFIPILLERVFGLRRSILGQFAALVLLAVIAAISHPFWLGDMPFIALSAAMFITSITLVISAIVWAMRICNPAIAASQFALFMAIPNLSRSIMSGNSGWLVEGAGYGAAYLAVAGIACLGLVVAWLARVGDYTQLPQGVQ
ncbi:MFS transporter [Erythrobacter sp. MTPC3]|uniref:MFS transporter n=1 Tax=Erythrobacter sp. MTPC3 TaxID=3056564 RepID=UPI0036F44E4B